MAESGSFGEGGSGGKGLGKTALGRQDGERPF